MYFTSTGRSRHLLFIFIAPTQSQIRNSWYRARIISPNKSDEAQICMPKVASFGSSLRTWHSATWRYIPRVLLGSMDEGTCIGGATGSSFRSLRLEIDIRTLRARGEGAVPVSLLRCQQSQVDFRSLFLSNGIPTDCDIFGTYVIIPVVWPEPYVECLCACASGASDGCAWPTPGRLTPVDALFPPS